MQSFLPIMQAIVATVSLYIYLVTCDESCEPIHKNSALHLSCSGETNNIKLTQIYWKIYDQYETFADCSHHSMKCFTHNNIKIYQIERKDPNNTTFNSTLLIPNVESNMLIKCFRSQPGCLIQELIKSTRILVDGMCPNEIKTNPTRTTKSYVPNTRGSDTNTNLRSSTASTTTSALNIPTANNAFSINNNEVIKMIGHRQSVDDKTINEPKFLTPIMLGMIGLLVIIMLICLIHKNRRLRIIPVRTDNYNLPVRTDNHNLPAAVDRHVYANSIVIDNGQPR